MKVHSAQARIKDRNNFQCGQWADITGIVIVDPDAPDSKSHICVALRYQDGFVDYIECGADNDIEFRATPNQHAA
jgi:hypothetical protein